MAGTPARGPSRRGVLVLPWSAWLAGAALPAAAQPASGALLGAVGEYREGRLSEAFGRFHELANAGDADAAAIALFMYRFGPMLYGRYWDATPQEVLEWERLQGSIARRTQLAYERDGRDPVTPPARMHAADRRNAKGSRP